MKNLKRNKFGRKVLFLLMFLSQYQLSYAQKAPITFETYKKWSEVINGGISGNGKFTYYTIDNQPIGSSTTIIESTDKKWKSIVLQARDLSFTSDSKHIICNIPNDSILIITLGSSKIVRRGNVSSYQLFTVKDKEMIALYDNPGKRLTISTISNDDQYSVNQVSQYLLCRSRNKILIKQKEEGNIKSEKLTIFDTDTWKSDVIYRGSDIVKIVYDDLDKQIAFIDRSNNENSIFCYNFSNKQLKLLLNDNKSELKINPAQVKFSRGGDYLFIYLTNPINQKQTKSGPEIWSYKDLNREVWDNFDELEHWKTNHLSIVNIQSKSVIQLQNENEKILNSTFKSETDSLLVIETSFGTDTALIPSSHFDYYICFTRTGVKKRIEINRRMSLKNISISPSGNYLLYFDPNLKGYFSYNVRTGKKVDLTSKTGALFSRYDKLAYPRPLGFIPEGVYWLKENDKAILQGAYDLWLFDLTGSEAPINITKGIGEKNRIIFNIIESSFKNRLKIGDKIYLAGFNAANKNLSFYKLKLSKVSELAKAWEGKYYLENFENIYFKVGTNDLPKAKYASRFLIKLESFNDAPNYYVTDNFKNFSKISNNQPQNKYNWLTSELLSYKDKNGIEYDGILYKPENFDRTKKYPVLMAYYKDFSSTLNKFCSVDLAAANFSIPYAVSNGYVVYLPDIISKIGKPGEAALQSVLAAREYLSNYGWVDKDNIAIAGHSFGGFETNYIITHTNKFKAAISGSGISEMVGQAFSFWKGLGNNNRSSYYQYSDPQMDIPITKDPDRYIKNSPILYVKNVTTPLLLMHNTPDARVPVEQSMQFFLMLASLQKPVWWLNYRDEGHAIGKKENQLDYNIKVFEFLDFYLKNKEEPKWMKEHL